MKLRKAGFEYRCNECHQSFKVSRKPHTLLAEHMNILLNHGANDRCLNCHFAENMEQFVNHDGTPIEGGNSIDLCHSRHAFSVEQARNPENCGKCHMGPDHPQLEIFEESKHGVAFHANKHKMNMDNPKWVVGEDCSAAPSSAKRSRNATPNRRETGRTHCRSVSPVQAPGRRGSVFAFRAETRAVPRVQGCAGSWYWRAEIHLGRGLGEPKGSPWAAPGSLLPSLSPSSCDAVYRVAVTEPWVGSQRSEAS